MTRLRVQAGLTALVLAAGLVAVFTNAASSSGVPQAGGRVLALIQRAPAKLASYRTLDMRMTISFGGAGAAAATVSSESRIDTQSSLGTVHEPLPNGLGTVDAVVTSHRLYVHVDPSKLAQTGGKHWVGVTFTPADSSELGADGLQRIQLLAGATGSVDDLGPATIDGVATRHYRVGVDLAVAIKRLPQELAPSDSVERLQQLQQLGISHIPLDVWLDEQGRARQLMTSYAIQGVTFQLRATISGSDRALHTKVPGPADVVDAATLSDAIGYATTQ